LIKEATGIEIKPSEQNFTARTQAVDQALARNEGLLIDPSVTRLINGFLGGYHRLEIGNTGIYRDEPEKNRWSHPMEGLQYLATKVFSYGAPRVINLAKYKRPQPMPERAMAGGWMK
jgi:hypothetical protein